MAQVACLGRRDRDLLAGHSSGGQRSTPVTMTIQTVNQQTAHSAKPFLGGPLGSMALAFLLLGIETKGRSIEEIGRSLDVPVSNRMPMVK